LLGLAISLLLAPAAALARDVEEAKRHFQRAETAYKLGDFKEAIRNYEAAYRAMPEPAFLFNIAQAHRQQYNLDKQTRHLHKALTLYKTYLRESQQAPNRKTVLNLIDELKQILSAVEDRAAREPQKPRETRQPAPAAGHPAVAGVPTQPQQQPPPPRDRPLYRKWWFWTLIAGGVAVAAGAGVGVYYATRGQSAPAMPEIDLR
jgi:tetratricopeptide (TPR) repeat protein